MPLVRYFLFTGVMLLSLLLVAERYLPKLADKVAADVDLSIIRIHSDHQWPAAVRIDTSVPMPRIIPPTVVASVAPIHAPIREANADVPAMSPGMSSTLWVSHSAARSVASCGHRPAKCIGMSPINRTRFRWRGSDEQSCWRKRAATNPLSLRMFHWLTHCPDG